MSNMLLEFHGGGTLETLDVERRLVGMLLSAAMLRLLYWMKINQPGPPAGLRVATVPQMWPGPTAPSSPITPCGDIDSHLRFPK